MPAQKRSHDDDPIETDLRDRHENLQPLSADDGDDDDRDQDQDEESDRSPSSESNGNKDDYMTLKLAEIRKEVQCPICLGIIKKTRTVMECLHRFCRECIDKSMRLGNNECPACRTHCASRRSLRDDPNYDALIAALYPDIDKYEEEELAFHDEEKSRNKQIQANIASTVRRQSEALSRKKSRSKAAVAASRRSPGRVRNSRRRKRRRNHRDPTENQESSDEDDNDNDGSKADSSSGDEQQMEQRPPKRSKRWGGGTRLSQPSSSGPDGGGGGGGGDENDALSASLALVGSPERLSWGKGGIRSHNRHGSNIAGNGKNARNNSRISKLVDFLRNSHAKNDHLGVGVNLVLVSINEEAIPNLQQPYLCVGPTLTVKLLSEYIASQTALKPGEVDIVLAKPVDSEIGASAFTNHAVLKSCVLRRGRFQSLRQDQTLADLNTHCFTCGYLLLAYQKTYNPDSDI